MDSLILLILLIFIMYFLMKPIFKQLGLSLYPFKLISSYLFRPPLKSDGMMTKQEEIKMFSKFNDGILVDGMNKRLTSKESFNHLAIISRAGGGKTSSYVIPNIFKLANEKCSMVITDLSGELFEKTSAYLKQKGFNIYVLNPDNLDESIRYNPLEYAKSSVDIDTVSEILIESSGLKSNRAEDKIWSDGAKNFLSLFIKVLNGTNNKKYTNLANLRHLVNNFGDSGELLDELFKRYADDKTFNEYKGLVSSTSAKTLQSYISTANTALSPIGINDNLEKLTYSHTFDFKILREKKTAVFIKVKEQHQERNAFLLNLFYTQLFNEMMENLPSKKDLSIYCLLDEFGNMSIPKFASVITTIRKYRVSISIILQNISQLEEKYSKSKANTILNGGISSKIVYSGADLELASSLEKMFGQKEVRKQLDGKYYYDKESVMSVSEIRTIKDNEALFLSANKKPLKIKVKPYYKDFMFNTYSKITPLKIKNQTINDDIKYIDLENIEW